MTGVGMFLAAGHRQVGKGGAPKFLPKVLPVLVRCHIPVVQKSALYQGVAALSWS
jgi:hypothetical protein